MLFAGIGEIDTLERADWIRTNEPDLERGAGFLRLPLLHLDSKVENLSAQNMKSYLEDGKLYIEEGCPDFQM
jgi:hypothetical protein